MPKYLPLALITLAAAAGCVFLPGCRIPALEVDSSADDTIGDPNETVPRIVGEPAPLLESAPVIPTRELPSPNGFDVMVKAAKSVDTTGAGSTFTGEKLSPEEDLKRQRASTQKNVAALAMTRQALKLPIVSPLRLKIDGPDVPYAKLRFLARMVVQENAVLTADGKPEQAVSGGLDVVEMGARMQGGSLIETLIGLSMESLGRGDVIKRRSALDAAALTRAARRMEDIESRRPSLADSTQDEMWNDLSMLRGILRPGWRKALDEAPRTFSFFTKASDRDALRQISDAQIESNFVAASNEIVAQARLPYSSLLPAVPDPADPLSQQLLEMYTSNGVTNSRVNYERNSAAHRMLMIELELQAFEKDTGKRAASLDELVPKYLSAVPRDPFRPESPLIYEIRAGKALLYSVGPDGVDDGGAPMTKRGVRSGNKGDMISGVSK